MSEHDDKSNHRMALSGVHKLLKVVQTFPIYSHSYSYNSFCTKTYGCLCANPYEGIYIMQRGGIHILQAQR